MVATSPTATYSNNTTCCAGSCTCCYSSNRIGFVVSGSGWDILASNRYDFDRDLASFKEMAKAIRIECWMEELLAIPRRMKRHFPRDLAGPSVVHAILRPVRRNWRRYRRLWRHAKRDWF